MQEFAATFLTIWIILRIILKVMMKNSEQENTNTNNNNQITAKSKNKGSIPKSSSGNSISILCRRMAGSNWENAPEAKQSPTVKANGQEVVGNAAGSGKKKKEKPRKIEKWTKYVAMDCEMVGIGPDGAEDMLARVSIVNQNGDVLMDKYVKAQEKVVDYRTKVSGIRPHDMENGEDFVKVQQEVRQILRDKILVGHSVKNDLAVLKMKHPHIYTRDTAKYRPLAKLVSNGATPSLKRLAKAILGMDIQSGEHSSVEDARAVMLVYVRVSADWERYLKKLSHRSHQGRHRS